MNIRELLIEPVVFIPPARALDGLSTDAAERRLSSPNHSVAEIVAHLTFWQDWFVGRCHGAAQPMAQTAAAGWPDVAQGSWPDVHRRFLDGLERAVAFGDDTGKLDTRITPSIEFPPLGDYTVRDALIHVANHNAHHLGQVIVLRQLLGSWPPPAGSWTW